MPFKRLAGPVAINAAAAVAGVAGTTLIVWHFGLAIFGIYTVALAKVALVTLGIELIPGSYAQFRLQDDPRFAQSMPTFFIGFGMIAAAICAGLIALGAIDGASWFILPYVFSLSVQRWLDSEVLAHGEVQASVSITLVTNLVRVLALVVLIQLPRMSAPDSLWASLAAGAIAAQIHLLARRPRLASRLLAGRPLASLAYLWSLRRDYPAYYVNSVLKRLKDTMFPLFCEMVLPSKAELGKVLVFTRSLQAVAGQIRVLELFLIHRQTRASLASSRARILFLSAVAGHAGVVLLSGFLLWDHGLDAASVLTAAILGLFMYPYVFELARRSDAYAADRPNKVTLALVAFAAVLAGSLMAVGALGIRHAAVLLSCLTFAQTAAALVFLIRDRRKPGHRPPGDTAPHLE